MKQFFLFTFFLGYSMFAFAQSADEIVNNHIKAIGGVENWNKINTMYMEMTSDFGGTKVPVKMWTIDQKGMKVEFAVQGMTGMQVVTDKSGWTLMPFMGQTKPEPTPDEQLKGARSQLDLKGEFIDYTKKGSTIEYLGEDVVDGVEVYKLKLTDKEKSETTYFIEKETSLLIKEVTKTMVQGQEQEMSTIYSNYKKVGDVLMAYSINGAMGNITVDKIDLNPAVDPVIFDMPKQ